MDLDFPNAGEIDSLCHAIEPTGDDTPAAISPRCKSESVAAFRTADGRYLYVCEDHALEPFRFPASGRSRDDLPDDYNELRSLAADEGISLQSPTREELISRLLAPRDPAEVEETPLVARCGACGKLTLSADIIVAGSRCKACANGVPELDPRDYAVTTPPGG